MRLPISVTLVRDGTPGKRETIRTQNRSGLFNVQENTGAGKLSVSRLFVCLYTDFQTRNNKPNVWPAVRAYDFLIEQLHEVRRMCYLDRVTAGDACSWRRDRLTRDETLRS